jgi:hypothetical protein
MNQPEPEKENLESEEKPFSELPIEARPAKEEVTPPAPSAKQAESKPRHFLRMALRWVIGFLIVFLLGVLAMEFAFYRPLSLQLDQVKSERDQAQQNIKTLQGQVDNMTPLATQNKTLQDQLSKTQLHVIVLSAEANVSTAQVSLLNDKPADARLVLNKTTNTLKTLQGMLPADQQKVATDMQNRLTLALGELDSNKFAAQSDLTVLETSLVQLENVLFTNP